MFKHIYMKTNNVNDCSRSYLAPEATIVSLMSPDIICVSIDCGLAGEFEENEW